MKLFLLSIFFFFLKPEFSKPSDKLIIELINKLEDKLIINPQDYYIDQSTKEQLVLGFELAEYLFSKNKRELANIYYNKDYPTNVPYFELKIPRQYKKRLIESRKKIIISAVRHLEFGDFLVMQIRTHPKGNTRILFNIEEENFIKEFWVREIIE